MSTNSLEQLIFQQLEKLTARACPSVSRPGLLIGLSGGPDSVALLLAAHRWARIQDRSLAAAHLNHQLRGRQATADETFCVDLCQNLEIPLFRHSEDPRPLARSRGTGLEDAARILRHRFFRRLLAENDHLHCAATGHHLNDQAETVIMRLFRGTGPDGMAGIRPVSGSLIHPLLPFSRSRILAWLEDQNQPWRTDASNLNGDNTRSRLRRELLPLARAIFGQGSDLVPARLADLWLDDLDFLEQQAQTTLVRLASSPSAPSGLPVDGLLELHPALCLRVLRLLLWQSGLSDPARLEKVHLVNILRWLREGTSGTGLDLPGGFRLEREFDRLLVRDNRQKNTPVQKAGDFRILVAGTRLPKDPPALGRQEGHNHHLGPRTWSLTCPAGVLQGNLRVRNWRAGDRLQPLGLDGSRKLSDLFQEHRIAAGDRPGVLLVEDDIGILWAVGLARSERTRLLHPGAPAVTITITPRDANETLTDPDYPSSVKP